MKCKNLFSNQSRISERRFGGQETLNHQSEGLPLILRVRICAFRKYFDESITVPIVIMFLHGCERILHKQQLYIYIYIAINTIYSARPPIDQQAIFIFNFMCFFPHTLWYNLENDAEDC